jgi:hypothetical protein
MPLALRRVLRTRVTQKPQFAVAFVLLTLN